MAGIKLHIGGTEPKEGWEILNAEPGPHVDHVGDIRDLSAFATGSCEAIYGSHVLEHVGLKEIDPTLAGFRRVLQPGGRLMVSVPDLDIICWAFINPMIPVGQRRHFMAMLYGGQSTPHDFHKIGFNFQLLREHLDAAGFVNIRRVKAFGLFQDGSVFAPYGFPISLNVAAEAPG